jgi:hypothetical protein
VTSGGAGRGSAAAALRDCVAAAVVAANVPLHKQDRNTAVSARFMQAIEKGERDYLATTRACAGVVEVFSKMIWLCQAFLAGAFPDKSRVLLLSGRLYSSPSSATARTGGVIM